MNKHIAFCGLNCSDCPVYVTTKNDDHEQRKVLAAEWSNEKYQLKAEDINCDGCTLTDGRIVVFCADCKIRECGLEKQVANCAGCQDYSCDKLDWHFERSPESKTTLDNIRNSK